METIRIISLQVLSLLILGSTQDLSTLTFISTAPAERTSFAPYGQHIAVRAKRTKPLDGVSIDRCEHTSIVPRRNVD